MEKSIIDVDYTEIEDSGNKETNGDITVNANPISTIIHDTVSGVFGIVNNVTNAVKEYNICRQQEETKRAEIRAYLKIGVAEINAKKEVLLKQLDNQHELKLEYIRSINEAVMKQLDAGIEAIKSAIEVAKETKDFSSVIELMNVNNTFIETRSTFTLQLMDRITVNDSISSIGNSMPKGYIE